MKRNKVITILTIMTGRTTSKFNKKVEETTNSISKNIKDKNDHSNHDTKRYTKCELNTAKNTVQTKSIFE